MAGRKQTAAIGGRQLTLSNLEKVLWPDDGYTKGDLIRYYQNVAQWILPHLKDRPLTLQRYPDGIEGPSFFEKQAPKFTPMWVKTVRVSAPYRTRGTATKIDYILCNDEPTLVFCANLASIVLHVWYSRVESVDSPDYALFDLDPFECTVRTLANVALELRDTLQQIGLEPLVKTSGGSGMHVVIPLRAVYTYDAIKQFGEIVARRVAQARPKETTFERVIARRPKGTVYLDYVQVGRGKTVVPPFSVRARARAPVSMPLDWSEVEALARKRNPDPAGEFARWTMKNAVSRLKREGDLWAGKRWRPARLEPAIKRAQKIWK
ncbi:MAG: non-homologous end-joining DNA ligase [Candidatus Eremiobacteraeota bacterium]|nr:non-homologous end-joining DNA ligase [Candidatus Eremiobacteraeota bacterium]MBV9736615.1 non-homologous end-joining DNA ligase [Candidatus Eremiobacteraeota bacterium]